MAIEAPYSKYKKTNFKIAIVVFAVLGLWFAYDGYLNKGYREKHTNADGVADSDLVFNQKAPFYLAGGVIIAVAWFALVKNKKIIADEQGLILNSGNKISYDAIEKIDKTYFEAKGYFVITYKNEQGKEIDYKLGNRNFDNLKPVLDELTAKIS